MLAAGGGRPKIENGQRGMRVAEKAEGKRWEPRFFGRVEGDGVVERLGMNESRVGRGEDGKGFGGGMERRRRWF